MKQKIKQYETVLLIVLAAFLGAGVGAFSKIGLRSITPINFTLLRFFIAGVIILPVLFYREGLPKLTKAGMLVFITSLATINVTLFILGVGHTTAIISQTLYAGVPLISAIITFVLYRKRLSAKQELGLLIGFLGVLVIIFLPLIGKPSPYTGTLFGNLLIFCAVISVSFYFVLSKSLQKSYSPLTITSSLVVLTIIIQSLLVFLTHDSSSLADITLEGFIAVLYSGIAGTAIYYLLYQFAIKKATPVIASVTLYVQPVFGAIWAWMLLGEKVTGGFLIGGLLTLTGVYLVTYSKKAKDV